MSDEKPDDVPLTEDDLLDYEVRISATYAAGPEYLIGLLPGRAETIRRLVLEVRRLRGALEDADHWLGESHDHECKYAEQGVFKCVCGLYDVEQRVAKALGR